MGSFLGNSYFSAQSFFFLDSMFGQKMASFFVDFIFLTPVFSTRHSARKNVISFCWHWHPHFFATCFISKGSLFLDFVLFFCQRVTFLWLHTFGCNCQTNYFCFQTVGYFLFLEPLFSGTVTSLKQNNAFLD